MKSPRAALALSCHCSRCRKWHGAAFASIMRIPTNSFRITAGEEMLGRYASSPGAERCASTPQAAAFWRRVKTSPNDPLAFALSSDASQRR
jgi:hypothetical protein